MSALPVESQPRRLGEILIARGKLDLANLERALRLQEGESREKLGRHPRAPGSRVRARSRRRAVRAAGHRGRGNASEYPELPAPRGADLLPLPARGAGAAAARDRRRHRRRDGRPDRRFHAALAGDGLRQAGAAAPRGRDRARGRPGAALRRRQVVDGADRRQHRHARRGAGPRRRRAPEGPRLRGAGRAPGEPPHHARAGEPRLRHPHRALREPPHRPLPHRRRPERGRVAAAPPVGRGHLAREDHGEPRHRRAAPAAGRAHQAAHPGQGDRPARLHRADDARRERGHAHPRQGRRAARLRLPRLRRQGRSRSSSRR